MPTQDALEQLAAFIKAWSFVENYHQDVLIIVRSHNILVASWWWSREGYKPRRWEVSIRFPDDLIKQYCKLAEGEQERRVILARLQGDDCLARDSRPFGEGLLSHLVVIEAQAANPVSELVSHRRGSLA